MRISRKMVEGDGFEPSKAEPTDLQSVPFGHSGTPPRGVATLYLAKIQQLKCATANFKKDGGGRWIRTIEGRADRFTICSLWPLGNPSTGCCYTVFGKNTAMKRASANFKKDGGGRWIRTIEGRADRFTICSLWPLGNPSTGCCYTVLGKNTAIETRYCEFQERWWREMDSNHRRQSRQIYNLFPLATREPLHGVLLHCIWQKYSN